MERLAFDDRILTWNPGRQMVSIRTVKGRLKIPFEAGPRQTALLKSRQGESGLILHKGVFYLAATCHVGQPESAGVEGFPASRSWRCRDCRYQRRKEVQRRGRQGRQASPSPPAQQTAKEADWRRQAKTEGAFGQGSPLCHSHQSRNIQADR